MRLGTQARVDKSRERRDEGQGDRDRHALTWNKGSGKAPKTERDCTDRNQRAEPTYRAVKRLAPEQKSFGNAGGKEDWIFSCTGSWKTSNRSNCERRWQNYLTACKRNSNRQRHRTMILKKQILAICRKRTAKLKKRKCEELSNKEVFLLTFFASQAKIVIRWTCNWQHLIFLMSSRVMSLSVCWCFENHPSVHSRCHLRWVVLRFLTWLAKGEL